MYINLIHCLCSGLNLFCDLAKMESPDLQTVIYTLSTIYSPRLPAAHPLAKSL